MMYHFKVKLCTVIIIQNALSNNRFCYDRNHGENCIVKKANVAYQMGRYKAGLRKISDSGVLWLERNRETENRMEYVNCFGLKELILGEYFKISNTLWNLNASVGVTTWLRVTRQHHDPTTQTFKALPDNLGSRFQCSTLVWPS